MASSTRSPWCCDGAAEGCPLCEFPDGRCPGHPRTMTNVSRVRVADFARSERLPRLKVVYTYTAGTGGRLLIGELSGKTPVEVLEATARAVHDGTLISLTMTDGEVVAFPARNLIDMRIEDIREVPEEGVDAPRNPE